MRLRKLQIPQFILTRSKTLSPSVANSYTSPSAISFKLIHNDSFQACNHLLLFFLRMPTVCANTSCPK